MDYILTLGAGLVVGIGVGFFYCKNMLKHNPTKLAALMAEADTLAAKLKDRFKT